MSQKRGRPPAPVRSYGTTLRAGYEIPERLDTVALSMGKRRSQVMRDMLTVCLAREKMLTDFIQERWDRILAAERPGALPIYMPEPSHRDLARVAASLGIAPSRVAHACFLLILERLDAQGRTSTTKV